MKRQSVVARVMKNEKQGEPGQPDESRGDRSVRRIPSHRSAIRVSAAELIWRHNGRCDVGIAVEKCVRVCASQDATRAGRRSEASARVHRGRIGKTSETMRGKRCALRMQR